MRISRSALVSITKSRRVLAASACIVGAVGVFAACATGNDEELNLATSADPLQSIYVGWSEGDTTKGVNILTTSSQARKGKATGALRSYTDDNYEATCGVTFVSHRYAVTAAHCVSNKAVNTSFTIEQYNTTSLNVNALSASTDVGPDNTNPWPNYTKTALTSGNGYSVTTYSCQLKQRCSTSYGGKISCPIADNADLALLYCSNRTTTGYNWVPVSSSAEAGQAVQVWWFHELVNLAVNGDDPYQPYMPYFNWQHYGSLPNPDDHSNNWHYNNVGLTLQPIPLISKHNKNNVNYTAASPGTTTTNTNIPVCHGTSGSGVMLASGDYMVGVVSTGGLGGSVLCADMNATSGVSMQYVNRSVLYSFANQSAITGDRG